MCVCVRERETQKSFKQAQNQKQIQTEEQVSYDGKMAANDRGIAFSAGVKERKVDYQNRNHDYAEYKNKSFGFMVIFPVYTVFLNK